MTFRQDHPKTAKSRRIVALPTYSAGAVRRRRANTGNRGLSSLLFQSRDGTTLTTANVRRQLRHVLGGAELDGVTPHMFRRTVASAVNANANANASIELTAEMLGHTDAKITVQHYVQRSEILLTGNVLLMSVQILESARGLASADCD
ncbi:tyrosine-type recombinase/integrase [Cryobacterium sp. TMT3-29-2]|uniref:tyrosine-type recombinase/integrase n=1 Tax=Cryobacterium sp. TMT3-29-2 TaxID=2555867 RepID=UPI002102C824|nr:tyrosine-type recombinase/integrase [Cryobacterium sp. TMT3-29-2]